MTWNTVLLSSETRQGCPLPSLLFKFVPADLFNTIREKCETKGIKIGKKEVNHLYLQIISFCTQKNFSSINY